MRVLVAKATKNYDKKKEIFYALLPILYIDIVQLAQQQTRVDDSD
jgi:hypothetical protein